jgi:UDPglucose--hexose-1-phosphate uridylyltransferase
VLDLRGRPHRRFNPLRREWVIVSPHRTKRPWQGTIETAVPEAQASYDPGCYLCPGNERAGGARNPQYTSTFAFENDFPALLADEAPAGSAVNGLLRAEAERGICRVLCFSPRHDLTLARMDRGSIRSVVDAWIAECAALAAVPWLSYGTIFENRGAVMGASNPHPHCQIWATEHVPNEAAAEADSIAAYRAEHHSCVLCDYVAQELEADERIVCGNDGFVALVPFWATWPFETLVVSRRHVGAVTSLDDDERGALAEMLKQLTTRYDNVFDTPFPYSMGFHQQPFRGGLPETAHLHAHFYPPLLRSATIRKFMVGFELLGSPQRDVSPEDAAERLKSASDVHYTERLRPGVAR